MNLTKIRPGSRRGGAGGDWQRRAQIGLSLAGLASMAATSLLQTRVIEHLPDPPLPGFNSDKVNLSKRAFPFGIPDGAIAVAGFGANLPLAAFGGANRADTCPWLPLLSTAKAAVDSAISGWLFYTMPAKERAWCAYCIVAALVNWGILALSLPEAKRALGTVWTSRA